MTPTVSTINGTFRHLIFGPQGEIEGALLESAGQPVQWVLVKGDEKTAAQLQALEPGQHLVAKGRAAGPSPKGPSAHLVHVDVLLSTVDGAKPPRSLPTPTGYAGRVSRLNFARHGEPNGVVLDTGDFVHLKPDGMKRFKLKPGDRVTVHGDARRLADDSGWAIEATLLNGKPVKPS